MPAMLEVSAGGKGKRATVSISVVVRKSSTLLKKRYFLLKEQGRLIAACSMCGAAVRSQAQDGEGADKGSQPCLTLSWLP